MAATKKLETDFVQVVPWTQIQERWGKREYKRFVDWMRGQTCIEGGVYIIDVLNYARQRNAGRKDPIVWD